MKKWRDDSSSARILCLLFLWSSSIKGVFNWKIFKIQKNIGSCTNVHMHISLIFLENSLELKQLEFTCLKFFHLSNCQWHHFKQKFNYSTCNLTWPDISVIDGNYESMHILDVKLLVLNYLYWKNNKASSVKCFIWIILPLSLIFNCNNLSVASLNLADTDCECTKMDQNI